MSFLICQSHSRACVNSPTTCAGLGITIRLGCFAAWIAILWETTGHNPVWMLGLIDQHRLEALCEDPAFMAQFYRVCNSFDAYMQTLETWYERHHGKADKPFIAYFSMEFGLTECLQNYSGGLGVLSGDHLKSASDLGVPLVGVGLLYQEGYFRQYLNADGYQQESYPINDYSNLPVDAASGQRRQAAHDQRADAGSRVVRRKSGKCRSGACRSSCSTPTSMRTSSKKTAT
jgi:glucan phosphorylase